MTTGGAPWPVELRYRRATRALEVDFEDGRTIVLPAELLRVESPSAEVRGHGGGPRQILLGKQDVKIAGLEPVGNYALRIGFDDGHDSGLFSWSYLHKLGREEDRIWKEYTAAAAR